MKRLMTTITGLMLLSMSAFSQTVTLKEMIEKTKCTDFACFQDFITAKGFCYDKTDKESPFGTFYSFLSCEFIKDGPTGIDTKNTSSFGMLKTGSYTADIGTASNKYYQLLLAELKQLGFKAYETDDTNPDNISVQYKSTQYPKINLMVSTYKVIKEGTGNWTYWNFGFRLDK